ncbi:MAG TPA: PASTA domain-containing protein [Candidatus Polarisedimenticolia bacterium]|nr:PASTA domain-containing protein [Candidatus Polarisedimenticolia bacterium]
MREQTKLRTRRTLVAGAKLFLVGTALAVTAAVSAYLTVRSSVSGRDVLVPDLVGVDQKTAESLLRKQGLALELVGERHDPTMKAGNVLVQEPVPGSSLKVDRKVKVVVSLGEEGAAVPEVRGSAARMAQITLQQQGYRVAGPVYAYAPGADENLVLAQDPLPGEFGARAGQVGLLISRGRRPPVYVMPDFTGRTQAEAERLLARAGLRTAPARHERSPAVAAGTVLRQRPESGFPVRSGDLITLVVADAGGEDDHE